MYYHYSSLNEYKLMQANTWQVNTRASNNVCTWVVGLPADARAAIVTGQCEKFSANKNQMHVLLKRIEYCGFFFNSSSSNAFVFQKHVVNIGVKMLSYVVQYRSTSKAILYVQNNGTYTKINNYNLSLLIDLYIYIS